MSRAANLAEIGQEEGIPNSPLGPGHVLPEPADSHAIRTWSQMQKANSSAAASMSGQTGMELRSGRFAVAPGVSASLKTKVANAALGKASAYAFVVCNAPVQTSLSEELKQAGVEVLGINPPNTYIVRADAAALSKLEANAWVHGVVEPALEHKLHAHFKQTTTSSSPQDDVQVALSLFKEDADGKVRSELAKLGLSVKDYHTNIGCVSGSCKRAQLNALAAHDEVLFVEPILPVESCLSTSVPLCDATYVRSDASHYGWDVTFGIIDSGFQYSHTAFYGQSGYPGLWGLGWNVSGDGDNTATWTDYNSHGTHVLGIMTSRWASHSPRLDGVNPWLGGDSTHRFRAIRCGKNDGSRYFYNTDTGINTLASDNAALVINNSWGGGDNLGNDLNSRLVDASTWNNGQLWVFAAGNAGPGAGTVISPGAAKNVLTVGNLRNLPTLDVAGDSSMGPTADYRFKPEIYAPGASVESANAFDLTGSSWKWGTSMAAPHVTAIAASLMGHYPIFQRHPAMLKAYMVASARRLNTITDKRAGLVDSYRAHWNSSDSEAHWGWYDGDISQGGTISWDINVGTGYDKMYVALCWTEPAPTATATACVNNDIDLRVDYGADGSVEWSSAGVPDNYEFVEVTNPQSGVYRFNAYGYRVSGSSRLGLGVVLRKSSQCSPIVSGIIRDSNGSALSGVTLSFSNGGGTTTSDSYGYYSQRVPCGWSGIITPSQPNYSFSPSYRSCGSLLANDSTENFTGTVVATPLANAAPVTYSDIPKLFSFRVNSYDWCAVGIAPTTDHDISGYADSSLNSPYAYSTYGSTIRDFIVVNGHNVGDATHFAQITYGTPSSYTIEAQNDIPDLTQGYTYNGSLGSGEVLNAYEVYLPAGHQYQCALNVTSGSADLGVYVFKASRTSGSRPDADWHSNSAAAGGSESLVFTTDTTGEYGIVVVNEDGGSANYSITVGQPESPRLTPPTVAGGAFRFQVSGTSGATYVIQASPDLVHWTTRASVTPSSGSLNFSDPIDPAQPQMFYRALLQ